MRTLIDLLELTGELLALIAKFITVTLVLLSPYLAEALIDRLLGL